MHGIHKKAISGILCIALVLAFGKSTDISDIRKPFALDNDVFVEKNLSSDYIVKFLYILLKQLGLDEQDLKIEIKEK